MKKKLIMLSLALISCVCVAVGLSACSNAHTHTLTAVEATAATCTTDGNKAYWYCADCGKYYSDANATTEISLSDTVISALGHDYTTTFEWSETDGVYSAKATRVCGNDSTDTETVDAVITEKTKTDATCTEAGSITYTATATFSDKSTETEDKTVTIAATGHSYATTWSTDSTYHWHAAICEHTDEISNKASHTFVVADGKYACSECGYELGNLVEDTTDSLVLGDNYLYFADQSSTLGVSYYSGSTVDFTAPADAKYTLSVPTDCKVVLFVDVNGDHYSLGDEKDYYDGYTISFVAEKDTTISIYYIILADNSETFTDYIFNLSITSVAVTIGSAETPYAFSDVATTAITKTTSLAAGASYYFSVPSSYNMGQLTFSSSVELYLVGTESDTKLTLTDSSYYFNTNSPATYYVKNTGETAIESLTISCAAWTPTLTTGTNTLTISSSLLTSNTNGNYIRYYLSGNAGYVYTFTLGEGSDSNVSVKDGTYTSSTVYLDSSNTTYKYGAKSTGLASFYIVYAGSADSFNINITITAEEEDTTEDTSKIEYTTISTLDTDTTCTISTYTFYTVNSYEKAYIKYTPATSGTYALTLTSTSSYWSNIASSYLSITLNGDTVNGKSGIYAFALTANTEYTIIVTMNNTTLIENLTASMTATPSTLSVSETAQTVEGGKVYIFTATDAGYYTFTVDSNSDIYVSDGTLLGYYDLYYNGSYGDDETGLFKTLTLAASDILYIYCYDDDATCSITITYSETGESGTQGNTLSLGDNAITITADDTSDGINYTITVTESGTYTFSVASDADAFVIFNNSTTTRITTTNKSFEVSLTAGTSYTVTVNSWSENAATYTLSIYQTLSAGANTLILTTDDESTYYAYTIYNASTAGSYYFTVSTSNYMFSYYGTLVVSVNSVEVSGSSFVYDVTLVQGENIIILAFSGSVNPTYYSYTLTLAEGESPKTDVPETIFGATYYDVSISSADARYGETVTYTVTTEQAGTYMLSIDSNSDAYITISIEDSEGYTVTFDSEGYVSSLTLSKYDDLFAIITVDAGYIITINYATYSYGAATYKLYVADNAMSLDETINLTEATETYVVGIDTAGDYVLTLTLDSESGLTYTTFTKDYCLVSFSVGDTDYDCNSLAISSDGNSCYIKFTVDDENLGIISITFALYGYTGTLSYTAVVSEYEETIEYVTYTGTVYNISSVDGGSVAADTELFSGVLTYVSSSSSSSYMNTDSGSMTIDSSTSVYEGVELTKRLLINSTNNSLTLVVAEDSDVTLYYGLGNSTTSVTISGTDTNVTLSSEDATSGWNVLYKTISLKAGTYTISLTQGNFSLYSVCILATTADAD